MRYIIAITLCLVPTLALAGMTAEEFDAYTRGKTFVYGVGGAPYGIEEYRANRQVRWSFIGGECQIGEWYEEDGMICFVYDTEPRPQCWSFEAGPDGLIARFEDDPAEIELYEAGQSDEPLVCEGPQVGV